MLQLLNKSSGKNEAGQAVAWHPNFRDIAQLPDTKTVRTKFFVNLVAITAVTALFLFVVVREFKLASLTGDLASVEAQIAEITKASDKAIADYKLFQEQEKRFNDAYALVSDPFRIPDFLIYLGSIMPPGVKIRRVDFKGTVQTGGAGQTMNVTGSVRGLDTAASDVASNFVKKLQEDKTLALSFSSITLTNLSRNVSESNMGLELTFTFKAPSKTPAKK